MFPSEFQLKGQVPSWTEECVTIPISGETGLSGVLCRPNHVPPQAVALLFSGSGPVGEDGDLSGPFLGLGYRGQPAKLNHALRDVLAELGIASLRYAKRSLETQTLPRLLADAQGAFDVLRSLYPTAPVFLVGLSEGAWVAIQLAQKVRCDGLFLLALPTRPIQEILRYQWIDWPMTLFGQKFHLDQKGTLLRSDFKQQGIETLPLLDVPIESLYSEAKESISFNELAALYEKAHQAFEPMLYAAGLGAWYESVLALENICLLLNRLSVPVYLYQGGKDAQLNPQWIVEDQIHLSQVAPTVRMFPTLGHCFSPMDGSIGQIKTSGPLDLLFLKQFFLDVRQVLQLEQLEFGGSACVPQQIDNLPLPDSTPIEHPLP